MQTTTQIVERTVKNALIEHLKEKEITMLLGPRQVGKTTLLNVLSSHLLEQNTLQGNIFYFNLDIITDLEFFKSQDAVIDFIKDRTIGNNFIYFFIDEIQRIENAGIFIKGIYDLGLPVKFIVSGSSSLEIKKKLQESLTGRKKVFLILPFSFEEFLNFNDSELRKTLSEKKYLTSDEDYEARKYLNEYILFGGYPRIVIEKNKEKKKELLKEIYSSYIEKDIESFLKVQDLMSFSNLVKLLAVQNGGLFNSNQISKTLNINQRTLINYVYYLEQTFIIRRLTPFFTNAKKEIIRMPKNYFIDTGIRNFSADDFSDLEKRKDKGELLENFVLNEISLKTKLSEKISFWRNKSGQEVDFIVQKGEKIIPMEIKYQNNNLKISRSFNSFLENYAINESYIIIGRGGKRVLERKNGKINIVPAYQIEGLVF